MSLPPAASAEAALILRVQRQNDSLRKLQYFCDPAQWRHAPPARSTHRHPSCVAKSSNISILTRKVGMERVNIVSCGTWVAMALLTATISGCSGGSDAPPTYQGPIIDTHAHIRLGDDDALLATHPM